MDREQVREEITLTLKALGLRPEAFGEYSKRGYAQVVRRFYYAFMDYEKYPDVDLSYAWLRFRGGTRVLAQVSDRDWDAFLSALRASLPAANGVRCYLLLAEGWVYEGGIDGIFRVLRELEGVSDAFYLVSKQFDWCAAYTADGACAVVYQR